MGAPVVGRMAGLVGLLLCGCNEFTVRQTEDLPPAQPPGEGDGDDFGDAPDWNDCPTGYVGRFFNLPFDHPDMEPDPDADTIIDDPDLLDWWSDDRLSFERFEPSLEYGSGWWPVDEGLADDPAYFSARWTAWIRVNEALPVELVLGAVSDVFVFVDGDLVASVVGSDELDAPIVELDLPTGQFPLEFRYAHRMGESGLRARFVSEHVAVCYPDFTGD